jgi:hypothetical protein
MDRQFKHTDAAPRTKPPSFDLSAVHSALSMKPPGPARWFFALVWLVNGVAFKLLDWVPRHREIVARLFGEEWSVPLIRAIGAGEVVIALWILSGIHARLSAVAQIVLVLAMNVIEFLLTPDLLLFGRFNSVVALAYCAVVGWCELRPATSNTQARTE